MRIGDPTWVFDASRPEIKLRTAVARTSGELDPTTRTLLTELDLDNKKGYILAGSFVQVSLTLKTKPLIEVSSEALLMRGGKNFVAVLTRENTVNIKAVDVFDSDGKITRIRSGLEEGQFVVLNPVF